MSKKFIIKDVGIAKLLMDERIKQIMNHAEKKTTVKKIAEKMKEKPSRLYYHIKKLEEAKLLKLVETKQIGNMIEKYYKAIEYDSFQLDEEFLSMHFDIVSKNFIDRIKVGMKVIEEHSKKKIKAPSDISLFELKMKRKEWRKRHNEGLNIMSGKNIEPKETNETEEELEREEEYVTVILSYRKEDAKKMGLLEEDE